MQVSSDDVEKAENSMLHSYEEPPILPICTQNGTKSESAVVSIAPIDATAGEESSSPTQEPAVLPVNTENGTREESTAEVALSPTVVTAGEESSSPTQEPAILPVNTEDGTREESTAEVALSPTVVTAGKASSSPTQEPAVLPVNSTHSGTREEPRTEVSIAPTAATTNERLTFFMRETNGTKGDSQTASLPVCCGNSHCGKSIGTNGSKDFFFFERKAKDVHFVLDPGRTILYKSKKYLSFKDIDEGGDIQSVHCVGCDAKLGIFSPFGPSGSRCVAFGAQKLRINGQVLSKGKQWWQRESIPHLMHIEVRDSESFFCYHAGRHKEVQMSRNYGTLELEFSFENGDFEVSDLLVSGKVPKQEQLLAFARGLIRNTIIVLPTGFGKTFIASLIIKRIQLRNPLRVAVMLVDRIPLVYQQALAISRDTGMVILQSSNSKHHVILN